MLIDQLQVVVQSRKDIIYAKSIIEKVFDDIKELAPMDCLIISTIQVLQYFDIETSRSWWIYLLLQTL